MYANNKECSLCEENYFLNENECRLIEVNNCEKLIDEKIPKENKTLFISFPLSEKFMLENTKYVRAKYDEKLINSILNNNATLISSKLENQKLFAFIYEYKQNEYPVVFLPVFNKISIARLGTL